MLPHLPISMLRLQNCRRTRREEGFSETVAYIEELKNDIKSLRESLKPQKAEIKQTEKEIAKLEAKKVAEVAKKVETEAVLKKLLASGMTADDVLK